MTKNVKTDKLSKRDWALVALLLAVVISNWAWYQAVKSNDLSERNSASAWLSQQVEINKLKACIDEGTKPCDISPQIEK